MARTAIEAMDEDTKRDEEVLRAKRAIIKILRGLPDDETRRRVMSATAVLMGHADAVVKGDPA